jgi:Na+-transporting NADH:ubiquinone oxidoreductase subunit NqrD
MIAMGFLRELLGLGTVWGFPILGEKWHSHAVTGFALPFGAFLAVGLGLGFLGKVRRHA